MSASFWDERYGRAEYIYGVEPNDFLRAEAHRIPLGRVLCLAEGEGRNATFLARLGYEVTAVDSSIEGLRKAERLAQSRGVKLELVQADLADYRIQQGAFSGIVSIFAHLPPDVRRRVHAQIGPALAIGGCFLLEAYRPEQLAFGTGGPKDPAFLMSLSMVREELGALDFVVAREVERDIVEGAFHTGRGATVQIIAHRRQ